MSETSRSTIVVPLNARDFDIALPIRTRETVCLS